MKKPFFAVLPLVAALIGAYMIPVAGQTTPINQAIALLTSGTTPFSIVGINASGYINWGTSRSAAGYGFRDNAGVIESKNSGGSWAPLSTSGGAPSTATYITQTPNGSLSAEQALSTLATALLVNTTTTGVLTAFGGTTCTNQIPTAISAVGAFTCANLNLSTMGISGSLAVTKGGTGLTTTTQGDILYADAANSLAKLAKSASATRYLSNTGTSNNPAWAQVALTTGVTGTLPVANGGSGITSGTSGGIPYFSSGSTVASSGVLTTSRIVLGGGAAASPTVVASLGTATTVLHGNAGGAPTFGLVDLSTDVTGSITAATGGTGQTSYTIGDLLYASGTTALSKLADVSVNSFLRSGGVATAPAWSTTKWPNSATTGDVIYASASNQYANLADVAVGSYLRAGGVGTAPVWSTLTLPNTVVQGDLLAASATNVVSPITAVAVGRVLTSDGVTALPVWRADVPATTFIAATAFIGPGAIPSTSGVVRLANTSLITARNVLDSGNITLIGTDASDRVLVGSALSTGFTLTTLTTAYKIEGTVPTISSGFGTTPSIAGSASVFKVTVGAGGDTTGVVLFNVTWSTAPVCIANNQTSAQLVRATPTTTQVTIAGTMNASDVVAVHCVGF